MNIYHICLLFFISFFSLFIFFIVYLQIFVWELESNECKMTYMYPNYIKLDGIKSKYSSIYQLFLYKEMISINKKNSNIFPLQGVPVLFIPGNAGSYKQVRSIASEAARIFQSNNSNVFENEDLKVFFLQKKK